MVRLAILLLAIGSTAAGAQDRTYQRVDGRSLADPKLKAEMQVIGRQCLAAAHNAAQVRQPAAPVISQQTTVNISGRRDPDIGFATSAPRVISAPSVTRDPDTLEIEMEACMARSGYVLR